MQAFLVLRGFHCEKASAQAVAALFKERVLDVNAAAWALGVRPGMTRRAVAASLPGVFCHEAAAESRHDFWDAAVQTWGEIGTLGPSSIMVPRVDPAQLDTFAATVVPRLGWHLEVGLGERLGSAQAWQETLRAYPAREGCCSLAQGPLAKLPLWALPLSLASQKRLQRLGLRFLGEVAEYPAPVLLTLLGTAQGRLLLRLARGDETVANPARYPRQELRWQQDWFEPIDQYGILEGLLRRAAIALTERLRRVGQGARSVTLLLRDGSEERRRQRLLASPLQSAAQLGRLLLMLAQTLKPRLVYGLTVVLEELTPWQQGTLDGQSELPELDGLQRGLALHPWIARREERLACFDPSRLAGEPK